MYSLGVLIGGSSNGRTSGFDPANPGSSPGPPAFCYNSKPYYTFEWFALDQINKGTLLIN